MVRRTKSNEELRVSSATTKQRSYLRKTGLTKEQIERRQMIHGRLSLSEDDDASFGSNSTHTLLRKGDWKKSNSVDDLAKSNCLDVKNPRSKSPGRLSFTRSLNLDDVAQTQRSPGTLSKSRLRNNDGKEGSSRSKSPGRLLQHVTSRSMEELKTIRQTTRRGSRLSSASRSMSPGRLFDKVNRSMEDLSVMRESLIYEDDPFQSSSSHFRRRRSQHHENDSLSQDESSDSEADSFGGSPPPSPTKKNNSVPERETSSALERRGSSSRSFGETKMSENVRSTLREELGLMGRGLRVLENLYDGAL